MTIKTLYVYRKPSGETVASIIKPTSYEYTTRLHLIADTGRAITNGTIVMSFTNPKIILNGSINTRNSLKSRLKQ